MSVRDEKDGYWHLIDERNAALARATKAELDLARAIPIYEEALRVARERAEKAEAEVAACDGHGYLREQLARAVEERDAALVLYKAILPSALSWCQRVPQVPVREAVAARELLRERGLLVGERG